MQFIILGCGSSMGVPRIDGYFGNCDPSNKKNYRTRCSALIKNGKKNILIDTSPDLRQQLLSNKIKLINSVFFTHMHADQTHGINDLRVFFLKLKKRIPIYADLETLKYLKKNFSYCFDNKHGYPATLKINKLKKNFNIDGINFRSVSVQHGNINSKAFIINGKLAYLSDANNIYTKDLDYFKNLKYFVVDCLRIKNHPSHFNLDEVIKLHNQIKPKKTILTNLHSDLDYNRLLKILPKNIKPAYDGMVLNL